MQPQIENGDKIIMPPSALDRLASLHIDYPMLFELHNAATERMSHCGVLEFIAEEGMIYMPYWMMENLLLQEGDIVRVKNVTLPKGTYVKLQPHTKDFLDISNPKAILETTLRNFSCLTTGDSIMVAYNNKKYYIDIIETKPSNAISIIETDCEVDFAPPLDYKEPEKPVVTVPSGKAPAGGIDKADRCRRHCMSVYIGCPKDIHGCRYRALKSRALKRCARTLKRRAIKRRARFIKRRAMKRRAMKRRARLSASRGARCAWLPRLFNQDGAEAEAEAETRN
ncbi:hypothetical protein HYC85_009406 [Camellia sinensis]|uniref:Uncharacterized protein n=1 Tax=Camellia sinensis TaxID=4442 RepID=A0A7J7HEW7_CAMSI|nr:hypothetical protein HYC85_009406 [Camellia sinensis]